MLRYDMVPETSIDFNSLEKFVHPHVSEISDSTNMYLQTARNLGEFFDMQEETNEIEDREYVFVKHPILGVQRADKNEEDEWEIIPNDKTTFKRVKVDLDKIPWRPYESIRGDLTILSERENNNSKFIEEVNRLKDNKIYTHYTRTVQLPSILKAGKLGMPFYMNSWSIKHPDYFTNDDLMVYGGLTGLRKLYENEEIAEIEMRKKENLRNELMVMFEEFQREKVSEIDFDSKDVYLKPGEQIIFVCADDTDKFLIEGKEKGGVYRAGLNNYPVKVGGLELSDPSLKFVWIPDPQLRLKILEYINSWDDERKTEVFGENDPKLLFKSRDE